MQKEIYDLKYFPTSPGLYIVQRDTNVVLLKITGMYPTLQIGKSIFITSLIEGNTVKEASKEIIDNIIIYPEKWKFSTLNGINMNVFPKLSFKVDGNLDLSVDELLNLRYKYFRLTQSGISALKIARAFAFEYKASIKQIIELINQFDKDSDYAI